jgi:hypothetical protein
MLIIKNMETKEQLIHTIKEWVKLDNQIRQLQKERLVRQNEKKKLSLKLMELMKSHSIDCFEMNEGDICYEKKKVKKPITKKILMDILSQYYMGDIQKATELNQFIVEHRHEEIKETIMRKIHKKTKKPEVENEAL